MLHRGSLKFESSYNSFEPTCFDSVDDILAIGTCIGSIIFYKITEKTNQYLKVHRTIKLQQSETSLKVKVTQIKFSPCKRYVAIGMKSGCVSLFDIQNYDNIKNIFQYLDHEGFAITTLTWSLDGEKLFSGCSGGLVIELSLKNLANITSESALLSFAISFFQSRVTTKIAQCQSQVQSVSCSFVSQYDCLLVCCSDQSVLYFRVFRSDSKHVRVQDLQAPLPASHRLWHASCSTFVNHLSPALRGASHPSSISQQHRHESLPPKPVTNPNPSPNPKSGAQAQGARTIPAPVSPTSSILFFNPFSANSTQATNLTLLLPCDETNCVLHLCKRIHGGGGDGAFADRGGGLTTSHDEVRMMQPVYSSQSSENLLAIVVVTRGGKFGLLHVLSKDAGAGAGADTDTVERTQSGDVTSSQTGLCLSDTADTVDIEYTVQTCNLFDQVHEISVTNQNIVVLHSVEDGHISGSTHSASGRRYFVDMLTLIHPTLMLHPNSAIYGKATYDAMTTLKNRWRKRRQHGIHDSNPGHLEKRGGKDNDSSSVMVDQRMQKIEQKLAALMETTNTDMEWATLGAHQYPHPYRVSLLIPPQWDSAEHRSSHEEDLISLSSRYDIENASRYQFYANVLKFASAASRDLCDRGGDSNAGNDLFHLLKDADECIKVSQLLLMALATSDLSYTAASEGIKSDLPMASSGCSLSSEYDVEQLITQADIYIGNYNNFSDTSQCSVFEVEAETHLSLVSPTMSDAEDDNANEPQWLKASNETWLDCWLDAGEDSPMGKVKQRILNRRENRAISVKIPSLEADCAEREDLRRFCAIPAISADDLHLEWRTRGQSNTYNVNLHAPSGLGLNLRALPAFQDALIVHAFNIFPNGASNPSKCCGLIEIGDVLIGVDDTSIVGMPPEESFEILKKAASRSKLKKRAINLKFQYKSDEIVDFDDDDQEEEVNPLFDIAIGEGTTALTLDLNHYTKLSSNSLLQKNDFSDALFSDNINSVNFIHADIKRRHIYPSCAVVTCMHSDTDLSKLVPALSDYIAHFYPIADYSRNIRERGFGLFLSLNLSPLLYPAAYFANNKYLHQSQARHVIKDNVTDRLESYFNEVKKLGVAMPLFQRLATDTYDGHFGSNTPDRVSEYSMSCTAQETLLCDVDCGLLLSEAMSMFHLNSFVNRTDGMKIVCHWMSMRDIEVRSHHIEGTKVVYDSILSIMQQNIFAIELIPAISKLLKLWLASFEPVLPLSHKTRKLIHALPNSNLTAYFTDDAQSSASLHRSPRKAVNPSVVEMNIRDGEVALDHLRRVSQLLNLHMLLLSITPLLCKRKYSLSVDSDWIVEERDCYSMIQSFQPLLDTFHIDICHSALWCSGEFRSCWNASNLLSFFDTYANYLDLNLFTAICLLRRFYPELQHCINFALSESEAKRRCNLMLSTVQSYTYSKIMVKFDGTTAKDTGEDMSRIDFGTVVHEIERKLSDGGGGGEGTSVEPPKLCMLIAHMSHILRNSPHIAVRLCSRCFPYISDITFLTLLKLSQEASSSNLIFTLPMTAIEKSSFQDVLSGLTAANQSTLVAYFRSIVSRSRRHFSIDSSESLTYRYLESCLLYAHKTVRTAAISSTDAVMPLSCISDVLNDKVQFPHDVQAVLQLLLKFKCIDLPLDLLELCLSRDVPFAYIGAFILQLGSATSSFRIEYVQSWLRDVIEAEVRSWNLPRGPRGFDKGVAKEENIPDVKEFILSVLDLYVQEYYTPLDWPENWKGKGEGGGRRKDPAAVAIRCDSPTSRLCRIFRVLWCSLLMHKLESWMTMTGTRTSGVDRENEVEDTVGSLLHHTSNDFCQAVEERVGRALAAKSQIGVLCADDFGTAICETFGLQYALVIIQMCKMLQASLSKKAISKMLIKKIK